MGERMDLTNGLGESEGLEWKTLRERMRKGSCGER
jgi:hypothetical protein